MSSFELLWQTHLEASSSAVMCLFSEHANWHTEFCLRFCLHAPTRVLFFLHVGTVVRSARLPRPSVFLCVHLQRQTWSTEWPERYLNRKLRHILTPCVFDRWLGSKSLCPWCWRLAWCMSVRACLINPPCHSASDSHSSCLAFSCEMFCTLDNSVRQIKWGVRKLRLDWVPPCIDFSALYFISLS